MAKLYAATGRVDPARDYAEQAANIWENLPSESQFEYEQAYRYELHRMRDGLKKTPAG